MPRQTGGVSYTPQWNFLGTGDTTSLQTYNSIDGTYSLMLTLPQGDARYAPISGGGYVPNSRTLTINGTMFDLSANRTWNVGDILSSGSYSDPSWITALAWSKITGAPTSFPTPNTVTFNNSGSGASSGTTFDGSVARTISYNTIGAQPLENQRLSTTNDVSFNSVNTNSSSIGTLDVVNLNIFGSGTGFVGLVSPSGSWTPYTLVMPNIAPGINQILGQNGSGSGLEWKPYPTSLPPSGSAGGDLTGTYPNPTLLNSAVIGKVLTGYTSGAGTVAPTDNILQAIQKLNGNIGALTTGVSSVTGTTNRITASPTSGAVVVDISASYVGQSSITTVGALSNGSIPTTLLTGLGTGVQTALGVNIGSAGAPVLFNGNGGTPSSMVGTNITGVPLTTAVTGILPGTNGGTGVNNGSSTITLGGNLTTSGAFGTTITATATTAVTLPTSGTLYGTLSGSITATQLRTSLTGTTTGTGNAVFSASPTFTGTMTTAGIQPTTNNSVNVGSTSLRYGHVYGSIGDFNGGIVTTGLDLTSSGTIVNSGAITPTSTNTSDIGSTSLRYGHFYGGQADFSIGATIGGSTTAGAPTLDVIGNIGSTTLAVNSPVYTNANSILTTSVPAGYFTFRGAGQTTLVSGTKAVTVTGVTTGSQAFVTLVTPTGVTLTTAYQAVCTSGTVTIQANVAAGTINVADGSVLNYYVIN